MSSYSKEDCISALKSASYKLGHSPSYREYEEFSKGSDKYPSAATLKNKFGFNCLKDEIYMESYKNNDHSYEKPDEISMSKNEWDSCSPSEQRRLVNVAYVARYKLERGCDNCGYDEKSQSLDLHHTDPKNKLDRISNLVRKSRETIDSEISKCSVICANCHRQKSESYLSV